MSGLQSINVYVHLTATSRPTEILETVKISLKATPSTSSDEECKETPDTMATLKAKILDHLKTVRNDGNKLYCIESLSSSFGGDNLQEDTVAGQVL